MQQILLILLITITYTFANVGKITAVKGEVYIVRDAKQIIAKSGSILELKDQVQTKAKAKALVLFKDNTSITVGNNSLLSVNEFVLDLKTPKKSKTNFGFGKGVFRTITGKIGKINPKGFKIKTKSASIGIRGTTLDTSVKVLPNGTEQVEVAFLKGHGVITNTATGVETPVNTGQNASMNQKGETKVQQGPLKETKQMDAESKELEEEQAKSTPTEEKKKDTKENSKTKPNTTRENQNTPSSQDSTETTSTIQTNAPIQDTPTVDVDTGTLLSTIDGVSDAVEDTVDDVEESSNNIPELTDPDTTDPEPTEPDTTDPEPTEPDTTDPEPTEPDTTDPEPTEPDTTDPRPTNPGSGGESDTEPEYPIVSTIIDGTYETSPTVNTYYFPLDSEYIATENNTYLSFCYNNSVVGCEHYDDFDFGYITEGTILKGAFITEKVTPSSEIIQSYINTDQTGTYTGSIMAIETSNLGVNKTSGGTINLDLNFGTNNFIGDITVTEGNWKAIIDDGWIFPTGFTSGHISKDPNSSADITGGVINGEYYGSNGNTIGGAFHLADSNSSVVNGVFGTTSNDLSIPDTLSITNTTEVTPTDPTYYYSIDPEYVSTVNAKYFSPCTQIGTGCEYYDEIDIGYLTEDNIIRAAFITEKLVTTKSTIEEHITNKKLGTYTASVVAIETTFLGKNTTTDGSINFVMDFHTGTFVGDISITHGNWQASINSGSINPNTILAGDSINSIGFSSSNITSDGGDVTHINGELKGNYYGNNGETVGGFFTLNSDSGFVDGAFGATGSLIITNGEQIALITIPSTYIATPTDNNNSIYYDRSHTEYSPIESATFLSLCDNVEASGCDHYDSLDFGYIIEDNMLTGLFLDEKVAETATATINSYITNSQIGTYSGSVAAIINEIIPSAGTINLLMNFGAEDFTGDITVTEGNWQADIKSGTLTSSGFTSADIETLGGSTVTGITGNIDGKYYGADSVGGIFDLTGSIGKVKGVFGATGTISEIVQGGDI